MIRIQAEPIDLNSLIAPGADSASGGLVLFLGMVRDQTQGKSVGRLEYEAFEGMALSELEKIEADARSEFEINSLDIVHRVGRLELGEVVVAIVARAAHRAAAFDACRYAIDTLKKTVPIWKKEFFEDGAVWVGDRP